METARTGRFAGLTRRWPTAAAVAVAALTVYDLTNGADLAMVVAASALVYLAAAAAHRRRLAWPAFLGTFVVITVAEVTDIEVDPTWIFLGAGAMAVVLGLLYRGVGPAHGLPLQTLAMAGFGAVAAVAINVNPEVGAYLVAAGLFGHAAWDVYHHRSGRTVTRSLAEFCFVLDTLLAVVVVVVTVLS